VAAARAVDGDEKQQQEEDGGHVERCVQWCAASHCTGARLLPIPVAFAFQKCIANLQLGYQ
jgi:hypothetical protein